MRFRDRVRVKKLLNKKKEYKIYNKLERQFSDGGKIPTYSSLGKTYYRKGDVNRHLAQVIVEDYRDNIILVEYKVKIKNIKIAE